MTANNYHEEEVLGKAYDGRLMRRLLTYARPYRVQLIAAVILLLGGSLLQLLLPVMVQIGIDRYLMKGDLNGLARIVLAYGGILLALILLVGSVIGAQLGAGVSKRLKADQLKILMAIIVLTVMVKMLLGLLLPPEILLSYRGGH